MKSQKHYANKFNNSDKMSPERRKLLESQEEMDKTDLC